jgi:hypothetical protein
MARTRLTNPRPLNELLYNPYQQAFLSARRARACPNSCIVEPKDLQFSVGMPMVGSRFMWSMLDSLVCPKCGGIGTRPYRRFYLRAGRRGGKTRIGAQSAVEECTVPGSLGWCCAPSYPELEDYVIPAFFSLLPTEWFDHPNTDWSEDRLTLRLPNMAEVAFRSLDNPNRGAGPGLHWAWIDEGRKIQELAWQILRPALTENKGIAFITSSPEWGEDWLHRRFWIPAAEGRPGYWAVTYTTKDNPIIDPAEVEQARLEMPPDLFRREYEASIEYPQGTIYGDVIDRCLAGDDRIGTWLAEFPSIHPSRPTLVPIDPGTDHPFAAVLIVVTPRGLICLGEYEERQKMYVEHAEGLKKMAFGLTPRWGIDKSQAQAAIELAQYGIFAQGAENDVDAGIQRVYAWMATGRMLISTVRCPKLIARLRQYRWADIPETKRGQLAPVPFKKDDDLPDALRYGVMMWPELPTSAEAEKFLTQVGRNLAVLPADMRATIERNHEPEPSEDGLVRVTDDFEPATGRELELTDPALLDFYR